MNSSDIDILYEDEVLFVINKPAGITVNNSETTAGQVTLQDFIASKYDTATLFPDLLEHDFVKRNGIVHRLDKETSGVILIAKTKDAFENLQLQFKERRVQKSYTALCHGVLSPQEGEISVPVGRLPWNRKQFGIVAGGKPSVTLYKTDSIFQFEKEKLSLLSLSPKTGRTHQIRVHLKYLQHPIFSDYLYAGRKTARRDRKHLGRVFLHAQSIVFLHPNTGKEVSFDAPLAADLQDFISHLTKITS